MSNHTPTLERISLGPDPDTREARAGVPRLSLWLWRDDIALLRALYRRTPGGYSLHIRAAVRAMCEALRAELSLTPNGRDLLHRLGQLPKEPLQ
jgi:hypothetical protein